MWYTGIYLYENLIQSLIQVRYGKSDAKHILQKENIVMIDIYTERKDSKDWIFYNDLYFNLNTGNEVIMELKKSEVIWDIVRLIRLKVITYNDLSDFSDELQLEVKRILYVR